MGPGAGEAGETVFCAGEIDLKAGFTGAGSVGENAEDDFATVNDGEFCQAFPVALLAGAEIVVENNDVCAEGFAGFKDFFGFPAADEVGGIDIAQVDDFTAEDGDAIGFCEADEFVEMLAGCKGGIALAFHPHEISCEGFFSGLYECLQTVLLCNLTKLVYDNDNICECGKG